MRPQASTILSVLVIAACCVAAVSILRRPDRAGSSGQLLVASVMESVDPRAVALKLDEHDAGNLAGALAYGEPSPQAVSVLESFIQRADKDSWLPVARNAVMSAARLSLRSGGDGVSAAECRRVFVRSGRSPHVRVRSTFVAACRDFPRLLDDEAVLAELRAIAASAERTLDLADRASSLLRREGSR